MTTHQPRRALVSHPHSVSGRRQFLMQGAAFAPALLSPSIPAGLLLAPGATLGAAGAFLTLGAAPFGAQAAAARAPAMLLAHEAPDGVDPQGFLVSEKLDGVRAHWDGETLFTRGGHVIQAPPWFVAALPRQALDGELWGGRGQFEATSGAVRRSKAVDAQWHALRYVAFELPQGEGTFAQRAQRLHALAAGSKHGHQTASQTAIQASSQVHSQAYSDGPNPARNDAPKQTPNWSPNQAQNQALHPAPFQAAEQRLVPNRAALQAWLAEVLRQGGEGLMLHRADAPYLTGRSRVLLKLKPEFDAEALVLGHQAGQGRLAGRMGALQVRNAQGAEFFIGTGFSDAERLHPPPVGSQVSYRHRGHTEAGIPRFASFWRARAS